MRKIKLEEISLYLPYAVRGFAFNDRDIIDVIVSMGHEPPHVELLNLSGAIELKDFTPVVRPLSDLTKVITEEGEPGMCALEIIFGSRYRYAWQGKRTWEINPVLWKWHQTQKLFEYHFDVFGWIKDGIAVNINEL